ncbi:hypothetical protein MASR1M65_08420 [Saprospiraceae bacterium]
MPKVLLYKHFNVIKSVSSTSDKIFLNFWERKRKKSCLKYQFCIKYNTDVKEYT